MIHRKPIILVVLSAALLPLLVAPMQAADAPMPARAQAQMQMRDQDIYGHQMMAPEERTAYRARMRNAKTAEEREQLRQEHHAQMVARARERGINMPDQPPERGAGPGRSGPGPGVGGPGRGPQN